MPKIVKIWNWPIAYRSMCSETKASNVKSRRSDAGEAFDFRRNCLFCGKSKCKSMDTKNPSRWRRYYLVRTVYNVQGLRTKNMQTKRYNAVNFRMQSA